MAVTLKADKREDLTKSTTKQIRANGDVPSVVYGKGKDSRTITVNSLDLLKTVRDEGRHAIISLAVEGEQPTNVMLHDYQMDPIKGELWHADFYIVNMAEEMDVNVPLHLEGEAQGVKEGGVLQQPVFELQVRAKPANIPETISVEVSQLNIGDSIAIADLPKESGYEFLDNEETTIATVVPPDSAEPDEAPDENAEPEMIGTTDNEGK
ncbi:50S ribosomal protein L25/general stress protein Ctc [Lentibacillus cibarius]|uniref:Large ribosomal subunit protein bL25 n=1 Tax=Lentibacillus cibarius TaxID=2583219 RepID=A0A5S3QKS0_9BACI|nr:50S ribosomal protein L25/general stress protein Ctc [Lentibacillus cibarius]TMN22327.1 50S ribosomal protein L25/general stress protein Ctc [Lentibacillus cibarius]